MKLILNRSEFNYEMQNVCRLFFPYERIDIVDEIENEDLWAKVIFSDSGKYTHITCSGSAFGKTENRSLEIEDDTAEFTKMCEIMAAVGLYNIFSSICGFLPQWGILTGVRPAKLFSMLNTRFGNEKAAEEFFTNRLLVSPKKISLCKQALIAENKAAEFNDNNSFSLYVSIPFCPTRCSYCSFVSHSIANAGKLVPDYVKLLCKEIEQTAEKAKEFGLKLKTVYWGGGTPTQLSAEQLDIVMTVIENNFDLSHIIEYTVEAGRPDTITDDKLKVLKKHNVGRISINPQTMNDDILHVIGRKHTVQQTVSAFKLARENGFNNINMDVIAGLPTDTLEGFEKTLDEIFMLDPENITVHTLSLKRSSTLVESGAAVYSAGSRLVSDMLDISGEKLYYKGYKPYYLYRQSKMLGNLENVGWSKPGFDCYYNIYMMNEIHTVLGVGAGAVSRLKNQQTGEIQRVFNYKYPYEYISRFNLLTERKNEVGDFYETLNG